MPTFHNADSSGLIYTVNFFAFVLRLYYYPCVLRLRLLCEHTIGSFRKVLFRQLSLLYLLFKHIKAIPDWSVCCPNWFIFPSTLLYITTIVVLRRRSLLYVYFIFILLQLSALCKQQWVDFIPTRIICDWGRQEHGTDVVLLEEVTGGITMLSLALTE